MCYQALNPRATFTTKLRIFRIKIATISTFDFDNSFRGFVVGMTGNLYAASIFNASGYSLTNGIIYSFYSRRSLTCKKNKNSMR
jgi:hypothetical protein